MPYAWRTAENRPPQLIIPYSPTDSHQKCDISEKLNRKHDKAKFSVAEYSWH